ncbi:hypothetical protein [Caldicellulosiruptor acetigenus]|uniref:Uncharacterized protein n=1 Tax=Caldicellulosiruptor acetigenus 6A TaxID=632516 RepID=G2PZ70_9FIRM|nr:hypothetical protein [Caldicellulosiruptor acetigenus]AEM74115.1 hypothetical protein Calla_1507 [Caldicellulosiruptor acetigenus 6A]
MRTKLSVNKKSLAKIFCTNYKGSVLIVVIIIIAILAAVLLSTISVVLASLNHSTNIYAKTSTTYGGESLTEAYLYYFNQICEDAREAAYSYYFDGSGNFKSTYIGGKVSPQNEPKRIWDDLTAGHITQDEAKDRILSGMREIIVSEVNNFMNGLPSSISFKVSPSSPITINKLDDLKNYILKELKDISNFGVGSFTVSSWSAGDVKGYTVEFEVYKEQNTGTSPAKDTVRNMRIDIAVNKGVMPDIGTLNPTSSTSSWNDLFEYAVYSRGSFLPNYKFTVRGGSIYSGERIQTQGEFKAIGVNNLICKGPEVIVNGGGNSIEIKEIMYIQNKLVFNGAPNTNPNTLNANKIYIGLGGMELNGYGYYKANEIYSDGEVQVKNYGNFEIGSIGIVKKLTVTDNGITTIKSGATLYCDQLEVRNNGRVFIEAGATLVTRAISISGGTIEGPGTRQVNPSATFPSYPPFIDDIKNFDFDSRMTVTTLPADPVGATTLGSVYDKSATPWEIVVYGESGINDSELITEVNSKLGSFPSNVRLYLASKGNITFSNPTSLPLYNPTTGRLVIEGAIITLGSTFNINISGAGIELIYKRAGSTIESNITSTLNYIPPPRSYSSSSAQTVNTMYQVKRRGMIIK